MVGARDHARLAQTLQIESIALHNLLLEHDPENRYPIFRIML